jgi:hypothetical protein
MKIIAIEHEVEGKTAADFQPHLQAEAAEVWRLNQPACCARSISAPTGAVQY